LTWLIHLSSAMRCLLVCAISRSWVRRLTQVSYDSSICLTTHSRRAWLIHMCDVIHSYVWRDSFICVTWLIHVCDMTHDSFICVTWFIHVCDATHSYVWHDSFICVTWLIHMCDMTHWLIHMCDVTHSYVWRDAFTCVTWCIRMCDMTHSYVWHNSCACATRLIHFCHDLFTCDMTHAYVWHTHWYVWHHSFFSNITHSFEMGLIYVWSGSFTCDHIWHHKSYQYHETNIFGCYLEKNKVRGLPVTSGEPHTATHCNTLQHTATHCNTC